jgi:hypothetical protein
MGFYDLSKEKRQELLQEMEKSIIIDINNLDTGYIAKYAADEDTYLRKNCYLILGRLYRDNSDYRSFIFSAAKSLFKSSDENEKQTAVYIWGEIGKMNVDMVAQCFEVAFYDDNPKVKNAIMGALKQMSEKNPQPTLKFADLHLNHPDPEVRRLLVHGIELRGRTHPEDVLPILYKLQNEEHRRVRDMIIHVLGQISYKEGCLEKVVTSLKKWENQNLVNDALDEIINVYGRYRFAVKSKEEAKEYIQKEFRT